MMNRATEVANNEYGTYKTRRRRETHNGNGKINRAQRRVARSVVNNAAWFIGFFIVFIVVVVFTTDINLSNGLGWAQFGLTFFILLFCTYSMFANFYSSGVRAGKNTDAYSEAHKHYDELKKLSLTAKCRGGLWSFADITLMTNSKAHGQRF